MLCPPSQLLMIAGRSYSYDWSSCSCAPCVERIAPRRKACFLTRSYRKATRDIKAGPICRGVCAATRGGTLSFPIFSKQFPSCSQPTTTSYLQNQRWAVGKSSHQSCAWSLATKTPHHSCNFYRLVELDSPNKGIESKLFVSDIEQVES